MYLARFSYDVLPINRQRAIDSIRREVEAARGNGLNARMLVPLTRGHGNGAALQFEVELTHLDQLDQFRNRGVGSTEETANWGCTRSARFSQRRPVSKFFGSTSERHHREILTGFVHQAKRG